MKSYKGYISKLETYQISVFGSNTEGRHGKGFALICRENFGAIYGQASGLQGQSWGLITKDLTKWIHPSRTPQQVRDEVIKLYNFALDNLDKEFLIPYRADSENLNAYSPKEMAHIFGFKINIPENIIFEESFLKLIIKAQLKK